MNRLKEKGSENDKKEEETNKDFFNCYISLRTDFQNVMFFEKIEFLV